MPDSPRARNDARAFQSCFASLSIWLCLAVLWSVSLSASAAPPLPASTHVTFPTPTPAQQAQLERLDLADYWVSEKLDGVRAHWNGHALLTRNGQPIAAPPWFTAPLPAGLQLEGELWLGRGQFDAISGLVRRQHTDEAAWRAVRYMLFEVGDLERPFSARVQRLKVLVAEANVPWIQAIPQRRMNSQAEVLAWFRTVVADGGEGLMLQRADVRWQLGRSTSIIKLTPWFEAEARVVGHLPGKGRLHGMTGALLMQTPDGQQFRIGSGLKTAQRRTPPPVGSLVTYRYRELTAKGLPRFPRFVRVRELP